MTGTARRTPASERELVAMVARYLEDRGYEVRVDPDGTDYFDVAARRGTEIGLIEVKVRDARAVLTQALRRRGWADWNAIALGSERSAAHLAARTRSTRAAPIGIWSVGDGSVKVHRLAGAWVGPDAEDPFAPLRARFRRWLDLTGTLGPDGSIHWSGVAGEARRASGGRGFAEWRLDELADPGEP
jgi:hypothetical protein